MADGGLSRRAALGSAGLALGGLALGPAVATAADPRGSALGQVKMEACLDGAAAVWTYSGYIYAVRPGQHPTAILAIAGGTTSWATPQADGVWTMRGATMSFFRNPASGAFLDAFDNPFTGKRNPVRPNILSGGSMRFPQDGSAARFIGKSRAGETMPGGFSPANPGRALGRVAWIETADTVMLMTDHSFEVPVQPQLEARTIFAARDDFFNAGVTRLAARLTTTTITPWLRWMDMADTPGHLVWHCSGEKLFDVAALPPDYRARAGALLDNLTTPPAP